MAFFCLVANSIRTKKFLVCNREIFFLLFSFELPPLGNQFFFFFRGRTRAGICFEKIFSRRNNTKLADHLITVVNKYPNYPFQ